MEVAHTNPRLLKVRRELFGHALRERRDDHALLLLHTTLDALEEIIDLSLCREHSDVRVHNSCWADQLLHHLVCALALVAPWRRRNVDRLPHARLELLKGQWSIVERAWEAETEVNEDLFSGTVVLVHADDLRNAHVALINNEEPIRREVVEQCPRPGAGLAAREVTRVVLDP